MHYHPTKKPIFLFITAILIAFGTQASFAVTNEPHQQAVYDEKLQAYMNTQMQRYKIPGAAIGIVRGNEIEYLGGFGTANPKGEPVTPNTPFLLASVSKSFTALGIMQLAEAGQIDLSAPVQQYLPWFDVGGGRGAEIRVTDLLYQTSGFSQIDGIRAILRPDAPNALEAGVRDLVRVDLKFNPGENYEYSNLNYNTLGLLIQELSGESYEQYIQEHIFNPLGMTHSYTSMSAARDAGAASGYYPFFGSPLLYDRYMPYSRATLPSAGLWSSVSDMTHYLIAQLNQGRYGNTILLPAEDTTKMHKPGYFWEPGSGYAMGWELHKEFLGRDFFQTLETDLNSYDNLPILFHQGDWANYYAMAFLLPEQDYGVVILMNSNDPTIDSALNGFAWDVTLIANGGEAQYFPPWLESFLVRNSRWIFALVVLLLVTELVWSSRKLRQIRDRKEPSGPGTRTMLWHVILPLIVDIALVAYLLFKLLPDNAVDLPILIRTLPDLGLLTILILLLAIGWGAVRTALYANAWMRSRKVPRTGQAPLASPRSG